MKPDSSNHSEHHFHGGPLGRSLYPLLFVSTALVILLFALAAFSYALNFNVGPLEGLRLDPSGNLKPEAPIHVRLLEGTVASFGPFDAMREQERWIELLSAPTFASSLVEPDEIPSDPEQADVLVIPWGTVLEAEQLERLSVYLEAGGGVLGLGRLDADTLPRVRVKPWKNPEAKAVRSASEDAEGLNGDRFGEEGASSDASALEGFSAAEESLICAMEGSEELTPGSALAGSDAMSKLSDLGLSSNLEQTDGPWLDLSQMLLHASAAHSGAPSASDLFQVWWADLPEGVSGRLEAIPVQDELLSWILPDGYDFRSNIDMLRYSGVGVAASPILLWRGPEGDSIQVRTRSSSRQFKSLSSGSSLYRSPAAAMAVGHWGQGRSAWLNAPLTQLYRDRVSYPIIREMLSTLIRYLAQRPVVAAPPWPGQIQARASLAVTVDDAEGARLLAEELNTLSLTATWFIPDSVSEAHPELIRSLSLEGEVAIAGALNAGGQRPSSLQAHLRDRISPLRFFFSRTNIGYLEPPVDDLRNFRSILQEAGFDYVLPATETGRDEARFGGNSEASLVILPAPALELSLSAVERFTDGRSADELSDDVVSFDEIFANEMSANGRAAVELWNDAMSADEIFTNEMSVDGGSAVELSDDAMSADGGSEEEAKLTALERLKRALPDLGQRRLSIVHLSSSSFTDKHDRGDLIPALRSIADQEGLQVETLGSLSGQWRARSELSLFSQQLRERRLHLRVVGAHTALDNLRVRIFLPAGNRAIELISHHFFAAKGRLHEVRPDVLDIEFDRLAKDRVQDFFLELEATRPGEGMLSRR